jgi:hypothetical protein
LRLVIQTAIDCLGSPAVPNKYPSECCSDTSSHQVCKNIVKYLDASYETLLTFNKQDQQYADGNRDPSMSGSDCDKKREWHEQR